MNSVLSGFDTVFLKSFVTDDQKTYHLNAYVYYLRRLIVNLLYLDNLEGEVQQESYQVKFQQGLKMLSQRLNYNRIQVVQVLRRIFNMDNICILNQLMLRETLNLADD